MPIPGIKVKPKLPTTPQILAFVAAGISEDPMAASTKFDYSTIVSSILVRDLVRFYSDLFDDEDEDELLLLNI